MNRRTRGPDQRRQPCSDRLSGLVQRSVPRENQLQSLLSQVSSAGQGCTDAIGSLGAQHADLLFRAVLPLAEKHMDGSAVHIIRVLAKWDLEGADLKIIESRISHQSKAGRGKAYVGPVQSGRNDRTNRSGVPAKEETAPFSAVVLRPFGCAADVMTQVPTHLFIEFNCRKTRIVRRETCRPVKDAGGLGVVKSVPQLGQCDDANRPAANREEVAAGKGDQLSVES